MEDREYGVGVLNSDSKASPDDSPLARPHRPRPYWVARPAGSIPRSGLSRPELGSRHTPRRQGLNLFGPVGTSPTGRYSRWRTNGINNLVGLVGRRTRKDRL